MKLPHVVIVGAGFGGITAVRSLAHSPVQITIIDRNNFHTFAPLLYQVATAGLGSEDVATNLRGVVQAYPNVEAHMATVVGVDFTDRLVVVDNGDPIPYDYLILAAGAVTNDFGVAGVDEHAMGLKSVADAVRVRSTILKRFETANSNPALVDDGILNFVIAGGGPTGVELCGALAELFSKVLDKDFKNLDVGRAQVILVERESNLLGGFSAESQRIALRELKLRGVDVRLGAAITSVDADGVNLDDGTTIGTHTVVWTAGVKANPLAEQLGLTLNRTGEIEVSDDLTISEHPDVFVIGDLAAAKGRDGQPYPQLAPVAMQQARHVANSIERRLHGKPIRKFKYVDKGIMATIGRRSAVAELPLRVRFSGTLGWLSWLGLHLVFLIGFRNRMVVLVNWAWNYFKWERGNRVIINDPDDGAPETFG